MSAPDKIYVNPDLDCPWTDEGCFGDVEYIRKDYLRDWAEKYYEMYVRITEQGGNDIDFGRMNAFSMMINKLNEI